VCFYSHSLLSLKLQNLVVAPFERSFSEATTARQELETKGAKTEQQMSKKHQEAERRSSVSFGDLLKVAFGSVL